MEFNDVRLYLIDRKLDLLLFEVGALNREVAKMSVIVDRLKASVEHLTSVNGSVVALIQALAQQVRDMKDDPVALVKLADDVDAQAAALAAAVTANTPTPPTPPAP